MIQLLFLTILNENCGVEGVLSTLSALEPFPIISSFLLNQFFEKIANSNVLFAS